ncbi:MAG: iron-sulfur cluster assembly protein [Caldisphaera sp.]|jgi:Predicted metal-sulfur cluster biosynthetic enzyme|uniref:metal-sulfur cluster assembly factor n=1 Tax=Caldisphaera sp. TaxID=2060322 RepID=UPI00397892BD
MSEQIKSSKRPPNLEVSGDEELIRKVEDALKEVYDPEIPVNVYDLGLVYQIEAKYVDNRPKITIVMTLTAIGCPVTGSILAYVEEAIKDRIPDVDDNVDIEVTFEPPWNPDMVSEEGRELLKEVYGYDVVEEWKKNTQYAQQANQS